MYEPLILIAAVLGVGLLYVVGPVVTDAYQRFRARRTVVCPEQKCEATVQLDAGKAARTAAFGQPELTVTGCSLWPEREGCDQECVDKL